MICLMKLRTIHSNCLAWARSINIKKSLTTDAVFILEPDALAHSDEMQCFNDEQRSDRYEILKNAVDELVDNIHVLAVYIDAGNSEWKSKPEDLVEPLKKSGVTRARGIAVNIASFVKTNETTDWSRTLVSLLGGNKGVIIDTSRNGNGSPDQTIAGTARWCNPPGRAIGHVPTTDVPSSIVDAYIWGKKIGESDGNCFNNPPAGVFVPAIALDLIRNSAN